jgi:hypothetical protein
MTFCYILSVERLFSVSAKISQYTGTALALVPLFHGGNFMVKWLNLLSLTAPTFSGKKSTRESDKCTYKDVLDPIALQDCATSATILRLFFFLMIYQKIGSGIL